MSLNKRERFFLVGPMGAGKSTIGKSLALYLGKEFIDLDCEIVKYAHKTIPEIFSEKGESGFRIEETCALKRTLKKNAIIATGGGIVVTKENLGILKQEGVVIYLYCDVDMQYERTLKDQGRPMINTDDRYKRLSDIFAFRKPIFESIADITVDSGKLCVNDCIKEICDKLGKF